MQRARRPLSQAIQILLAAGVGLAVAGCEELGVDPTQLGGLLGGASSSDESVAGLKEALLVGAERSVARTSRPGGFLDDPRIRIPLPKPAEGVGKALRALGFAGTVDEVEVSMNRAAEKASGDAMDLIAPAVSSLTIEDAAKILAGPDDAATTYFRSRTEDALRARFSPVVETAMRNVGVYRAYDELVERNRVLALLADPKVELNRYVTDETLDGLFTLIGDEEKRIRNDPAARTTELLQRVFGQFGRQ